jgi:phytoene dehydrogenase-like protein
VEVLEAEAVPGGAVRTMELTLPGFWHDFGSAVHPLGIGSPLFSSLRLDEHGLHWIHSAAVLAHPLDNGTAVILERDLEITKNSLGGDGDVWARLIQPFANRWSDFAPEILRPVLRIPKHPWVIARFGAHALLSATGIAHRFRSERTQALFAGLASHSFLSLTEPLSGAFGLIMAIAAHAVGWPIPRGGSQSLTNALLGHLSALGGKLKTSSRVESISANTNSDLFLCDVTPRQLLAIAGERLSAPYKRCLASYRYGPGAFKVDYALSDPIPWKAPECSRAATVHLGGTMEEIAASENAVREGRHSDRPFVILVQPALFDSSRAPAGRHIAWAYCHVPNGSTVDMLPRLESQVERFAPGFRECILARRVFAPSDLECMDANLVGGAGRGLRTSSVPISTHLAGLLHFR